MDKEVSMPRIGTTSRLLAMRAAEIQTAGFLEAVVSGQFNIENTNIFLNVLECFRYVFNKINL